MTTTSDGDLDTLIRYADSLRENGKAESAIEAYRLALQFGAEPERVAFALAALGVGPIPLAAPADYVRQYFSGFADTFDGHMKRLAYCVPELLLLPLIARIGERRVDVLDLGCGTGLCGAILKPIASRLVGVDISEQMLDQARQLDTYDELVCADITDAVNGYRDEFDVVVAADVLIYLGDMRKVMAAVRLALRPGGLFAFSVEADPGDAFSLHADLRYAHSLPYLEKMAVECGYITERMELHPIRRERHQNVDGYIVLMQSNMAERT